MTDPADVQNNALALRRAFDSSFASAPLDRVTQLQDFLALRIGGDSYALRVREISGFAAAGKIVPLPSQVPGILGIAGAKGVLVPTFSLASLLGYARSSDTPRWLALIGTSETVALAFGEFEGYLRVPPSDVFTPEKTGVDRNFIDSAIRAGNVVRSIISVSSVIGTIMKSPGRAGSEHPR